MMDTFSVIVSGIPKVLQSCQDGCKKDECIASFDLLSQTLSEV